jgi:hypothetical protein
VQRTEQLQGLRMLKLRDVLRGNRDGPDLIRGSLRLQKLWQ